MRYLVNRDFKQTLNLAVGLDDKVIGDLVVRFDGMKDTYEIGYCFNSKCHGPSRAVWLL